MSLDTRNGIIAIIAASTMAALLIISLVGILILAAMHDGELARTALGTFTQIIIVITPAFAALAGVHVVVNGLNANKAISATSAVQVAQVAQGVPATGTAASVVSEPTNDVAGAGAVDTVVGAGV